MGVLPVKRVRKIKLQFPFRTFSTDRSATVTLGKRNMYSHFFKQDYTKYRSSVRI